MSNNKGFVRVAAAVPSLKLADTEKNTKEIIKIVKDAEEAGIGIILFPELCITGVSCGDLFLQPHLYDMQIKALKEIVHETEELDITVILGMYSRVQGKLFNCAAVIQEGVIAGIVPKQHETFSEEMLKNAPFVNGKEYTDEICMVDIDGEDVEFGNILFNDSINDFAFGIAIGDDMVHPASSWRELTGRGAQILFNPAAETATAGKLEQLIISARSITKIGKCGLVYASSGIGESVSDGISGGYSIIAENGVVLGNNVPMEPSTNVIYTEIDIEYLTYEKSKDNFCTVKFNEEIDESETIIDEIRYVEDDEPLSRKYSKLPFLDVNPGEVFVIQSTALARRIEHIHAAKSVVGISGGLDSTLAILATVNAHKALNKPVSDIIAVTMPGFGTSGKTYENATKLMEYLGVELREVSIADSVRLHFKGIGQDENNHDVTYENAQARERTQILMDIANMENGLVVGTGDLSEMALGWCTYNGDHMSMYSANAGIPKTQVRQVVRWITEQVLQGPSEEKDFSQNNAELAKTLQAILDTPVSPELLPPDENDEIAQITEEKVGPYDLNDFFIYYTLKFGMTPGKLFRVACSTFDEYSNDVIKKWLKTFYRRFFTQQFKRSCSPDGPKVGEISLSPRGAWNMPSDAFADAWLSELVDQEENDK